MTIGTALRAHLLADATLAAVVTARIYALRLPQKPTLPAVVLQRISGFRWKHLRGSGALARPRFQVDSWAQTHDAASELGAVVRQRLEGFTGEWPIGGSPPVTVRVSVLFEDERDLFEEDVLGGLCRHSADYFLFHQTAGGTL